MSTFEREKLVVLSVLVLYPTAAAIDGACAWAWARVNSRMKRKVSQRRADIMMAIPTRQCNRSSCCPRRQLGRLVF